MLIYNFLICLARTVLAKIDEKSHDREDRIERDGIVEGILKDAGMPLLRFENHGSFSKDEIKKHSGILQNTRMFFYLSIYLYHPYLFSNSLE